MDLRTEAGFLGTNASLLADLTLLAYVIIIVPAIIIGYFFARRKWFEPHHKLTMTAITLGNWIFIIFVMAVSYTESVQPAVPENLSEDYIFIPTIHLITGLAAQLLASYLVIRMWLEDVLPDWLKIKNIKLFMRLTLGLWLVTAALGVTLYIVWYSPDTTSAQDVPPPVSTEEVTPETTAIVEPVTTETVTPPATDNEAEATETPSVPVTTEEPPLPATTPDIGDNCQTQLDAELAECNQEANEDRSDCESEDDPDERAECLQEVDVEQAECEAEAQAEFAQCS